MKPKDLDKLLEYLGGDWDVIACCECGELIVVEINTGEPQTCNRISCVYKLMKDEL